MEFWEEALNEMTTEVREQIKADLESKYPHVEFRSYYINASDGVHVISTNNFKFKRSKEFLNYLAELEKKYAPDYDIFDIAFSYDNFKKFDKHSAF